MTEEVWAEPARESGICILCAKCRPDCLQSTQGWVCHECWQKALSSPQPPASPGRLAVLPNPRNQGYALLDPGCVFITIDKVLYFFRRECDALELLDRYRKQDPSCATKVVRISVLGPFLYVMGRPELKMVCVRDVERLEGGAKPQA